MMNYRDVTMSVAALVLVAAGARADRVATQRQTHFQARISTDCAQPAPGTTADALDRLRESASRLRDMTATAEVRDVNREEFARMKKEAQTLQFKRLHFYYQ